MTSYLFHLTFELYLYPYLSPGATASAPALDSSRVRLPYLPAPGTNIFTDHFPVHGISPWAVSRPDRSAHRRTRTATPSDPPSSAQETKPGCQLRRRLSDGAFSRREALHKGQSPWAPRHHPAKQSHIACARDWRYGPVSIDSIDMQLSADPADRAAVKCAAKSKARNASNGLTTKAKFIPSNPKNIELGWGVVHLYRDGQETPGLEDDGSSSTGSDGTGEAEDRSRDEEECTTLCILAVPSYMMPSDLLGFLGEQTREEVSHFRLIRTSRKNQYMVLLKFREARKAKQWRQIWNGKLFNSMEPEHCHVVFVKSIQFQTSADASTDPTNFPLNTNDPFTPAAHPNPIAPIPAATSLPSSSSDPSLLTAPQPLTTKPFPPPTASLVELPTCPVCLERMDETSGLLTILCQHVFHCSCLIKWTGSGCPVCRYTQSGSSSLGLRGSGYPGDEENECSVCRSTSNLWICLICGNVGCGRYDDAHAFAHYEASGHCFAMDIATQHVWDYAGDGYVHRLIQNKADGKVVELPSAAFSSVRGGGQGNGSIIGLGEPMMSREKFESMGLEYTYLLTSQLESQRGYYEEQLERAVDKASKASSASERAEEALRNGMGQLSTLQASYEQLVKDIVPSLERERGRLEKRAEKFEGLARDLGRQLKEEKTVSGSLMERIQHLDGKVTELKVKNEDLQEQNRDLTCFISGAEQVKKLEEQGEGVAEGTVGLVESASAGGKKRKGKGKGKGKKLEG